MGELKPCPFCGEPVELHPAIARGHYPVILHVPGVGKPVCGMDAFHLFSGGGTDHESLIEAWNARVESVNADLLEALKELEAALLDGLCNSGVPDFDPERLERARITARAAISLAEKSNV